ncbi:MAG: ABC transporter ATP-binding protein [Candidatus Faecousia sp.]|nr:ABC transporter ATP-binding protein [Candidatus Faecousia sp.]
MEQNAEKITLRETWRIHLRAYRDIRAYCPGLFAATALYTAGKALSPYVTIWLSARILDELAAQRRPEVLWKWVAAALITGVLLTLAVGVLEHWVNALYERFTYRRYHMLSSKMLTMDFADVDNTHTHDLRSQIYQSESWAGWGINQLYAQFQEMTRGLFGILGAIALTVSLFTQRVPETAGRLTILNHPLFFAALAALLGGITFLSPILRNKAKAYWAGCAEDARLGNRIFGAFGFLSSEQSRAMDFRMYRQQEICRSYLDRDEVFGVRGKMAKLAQGPMGFWAAASCAVSVVLTGFVYAFVCLKAWAGAFGVGSVTQYVGAVTSLSGSISTLVEAVGTLKANVPFMRTLYEFLDIPNSMYQGSLTKEKRSDRNYQIEFRDVSFRYPGAETWALRHVNMKFRVGSRLAIVGENGSGKTTFIKLLCRLYDPQEGEILLNGIDIRKYNYRDYMGVFSVVFQDFQLLSQSLGSNVAGSVQYDPERVKQALTDAGFGERLSTLEKGLDTILYKDLSEDGVDISGGEAQKIAIARALYKNAPFIILDEPTAALDPLAEAEIYSKFNEISGDKTAIYISHRLSSCIFCDEIAVFHQGQVIQQGTHEALLADTDGKYHALWTAQAQYYTR